jgi:hypothetical protein
MLESFENNLRILFNIIAFLNLFQELVLRFDIPTAILNSDRYNIILVKFILNLLLFINFRNNSIFTLKILAPKLVFDTRKMPFIKQIFEEIYQYDNEKNQKEEKDDIKKDTKEKSCENFKKFLKIKSVYIQMKIYHFPQIFNVFLRNNLDNIIKINIGYMDEVTFSSFLEDFFKYSERMKNLYFVKLSLDYSITSYDSLEKNILDFIVHRRKGDYEKSLSTNLKITSEEKMEELVKHVYIKSKTQKMIIQLGNFKENNELLEKSLNNLFYEPFPSKEILFMIMRHPKYNNRLNNQNILKCISSFYGNVEPFKLILCRGKK